MSKKEKRLEKTKNNPKNVDFKTIESILISNGFTKRQPHSGSSHYTFIKGDKIITIPYSKPIKECYVKSVLSLITESEEEKQNEKH